MSPNAGYSGPHAAKVSKLQAVPFTSDTAEFNAVKSGAIDEGYVPLTDLPQINSVKSTYNVFGYPGFGFNYVTYNFKDTTGDFNNIIKQLYIRQAFAHLEDQKGYIKAFFHGAGGPGLRAGAVDTGDPVHAVQRDKQPVPLQRDLGGQPAEGPRLDGERRRHRRLLEAGYRRQPVRRRHPRGHQARVQPDLQHLTGDHRPADHRPGIAGEEGGLQHHAEIRQLQPHDRDVLQRRKPEGHNLWAMEDFGGFSISSYPTTNGIFNTPGSFNIGSYSDPKADSLIKASTTSSNGSAVKNEAAYLTEQQPSLFQPLVDNVEVWKKTMSGQPASFENLTQYQLTPEFWYFTK